MNSEGWVSLGIPRNATFTYIIIVHPLDGRRRLRRVLHDARQIHRGPCVDVQIWGTHQCRNRFWWKRKRCISINRGTLQEEQTKSLVWSTKSAPYLLPRGTSSARWGASWTLDTRTSQSPSSVSTAPGEKNVTRSEGEWCEDPISGAHLQGPVFSLWVVDALEPQIGGVRVLPRGEQVDVSMTDPRYLSMGGTPRVSYSAMGAEQTAGKEAEQWRRNNRFRRFF